MSRFPSRIPIPNFAAGVKSSVIPWTLMIFGMMGDDQDPHLGVLYETETGSEEVGSKGKCQRCGQTGRNSTSTFPSFFPTSRFGFGRNQTGNKKRLK